MVPNIVRTLSIIGTAAALTGCDKNKTAEPPYRKAEPPYHKVDDNHYFIPGPATSEMAFSSNLAKWRGDVSGNFTLVPVDSENPTYSGMAAYRTTTTSSDGKPNTIKFSGGGSAESK